MQCPPTPVRSPVNTAKPSSHQAFWLLTCSFQEIEEQYTALQQETIKTPPGEWMLQDTGQAGTSFWNVMNFKKQGTIIA